MSETDREPTRADVVLEDRYGWISDCTDRLLIYDLENEDAWVRSDTVVALDEHR